MLALVANVRQKLGRVLPNVAFALLLGIISAKL